jgi:hypothetical protein
MVRFNDLVGLSRRPAEPQPARRQPMPARPGTEPLLTDDLVNSGFVSAVVDDRRGRRLRATRRTFLRSSVAAAAATTAVSFANLFGPARRVEAQTGVVGEYPRRILTFCPPYNANDNCQPGCGSSPICTDCCGSDGFFRNDPANGYTLYAGGCGDGDIADGWLWRFNGVCGNCSTIEYRCSDGYVQTDTGPAPFICRTVTECVPLGEEQAPGENLPDAAVATNWRPAGRLESAVDNGGSVTINGWIADASGQPVDMRITANNQIIHFGKAGLSRPDVAGSVRGAGPNTGYAVSFPVEPGDYRFCVNALQGALSVTIGCVNLSVGSGQSVRGDGGSTTISGLPTAPTPTPEPDRSDDTNTEPTPTPAPTVTPTPEPSAVDIVSETPSTGIVQVLRRSGATTGFVSGWAGDADTDRPVEVEVLVDGEPVATTSTELPRPDVASAFPELGSETGFALSFELPEAEATVCVELIDPQDQSRTALGCRTLGAAVETQADDATSTGRPSGSGDALDAADVVWGQVDEIDVDGSVVTIRGWAVSPNDIEQLITLTASATGVSEQTETGLDHDEARLTYGVDHPCGFELTLELPTGQHVVTVVAETATGTTRALAEEPVVIA